MDGGSYSSISDVSCADETNMLRLAVKRALQILTDDGPDTGCLDKVRAVLLASLENGPQTTSRDMTLTARQRETLSLLAEGLSNRLIAKRMSVEEDVVKGQVRALLDRLGMRNRTALALWAVKNGLVPMGAG